LPDDQRPTTTITAEFAEFAEKIQESRKETLRARRSLRLNFLEVLIQQSRFTTATGD
jgi:hypothetical protein